MGEVREVMAKILVVDDEKLIVKGIRFSLEQDGMEVDCAYDGEEAIQLAKQNEYDVVLLDVMLPKFDGFNVRLRQGVFWYYFEENGKPAPKVRREGARWIPSMPADLTGAGRGLSGQGRIEERNIG